MSLFQIISIPTENNKFSEALGISDERRNTLCKHLELCHRSEAYSKLSDVLEAATSICENINETAFICFNLGAIDSELSRMKHAHDFMQHVFKNGPFRSFFSDDEE